MTDKPDVHAPQGADEQKIWDELNQAEAAAASPDTGTADPAPAANPDPAPGSQIVTDPPADAGTPAPAGAKPADAPNAADDTGTGKPAPAAVDIWANAPPEARAAYEATQRELEAQRQANQALQTNYRRVSGTVSGLQKKLDKFEKAGTAPAAPAGSEPAGDPASGGIFDDPEIQKAEKEYPEVFGPLKKAFKALEERNERLAREMGGISEDHRAQNLDAQLAIVTSQHPDYDKIARTPQFHAWYEKAPAYIRAGVERNAEDVVDGDEVAHILRIFKTETGYGRPAPSSSPAQAGGKPQSPSPTNQRRSIQMESAAAPRGRGPAAAVSNGPASDDPEAIWKYLDEQERRAGQTR